jgi:hypothetical protein
LIVGQFGKLVITQHIFCAKCPPSSPRSGGLTVAVGENHGSTVVHHPVASATVEPSGRRDSTVSPIVADATGLALISGPWVSPTATVIRSLRDLERVSVSAKIRVKTSLANCPTNARKLSQFAKISLVSSLDAVNSSLRADTGNQYSGAIEMAGYSAPRDYHGRL